MKRILAAALLFATTMGFAQEIQSAGDVKFSGDVSSNPALPLVITTKTLPLATVQSAYAGVVQTVNGIGSVTCAFTSAGGDAPPGIVFNPDCTITGTPTSPGSRTFHITATDSAARTASQQFIFNVLCSPLQLLTPTALPPADQGFPWRNQFLTLGGISPLSFSGSGFPTGVTVNSSTGLASGTPTVSGAFTPSIAVSDSCPSVQTLSQPLTLTVNGTLAVTTTNVPTNAIVGAAYNGQMANAGGTGPFSWGVSPTLPAGLNLNTSTGAITGTATAPTAKATYTFTVTDSLSNNTSAAFPIAAACQAIVFQTTTLQPGTQNSAYQYGISVSGGYGTLSYAASGLPTGLSINPSTGVIAGTTSSFGDFSQVVVTVTDACPAMPQIQPQTFDLVIAQQVGPLTITTSLPNATEGVPYGPISMAASGGVPPYTWALVGGAFPTGVSMTSGVVSGTPTTTGTSNPDIKVTDSVLTNTHTVFPIVVSCATLSITTPSLTPGTQGVAYSFGVSSTGGTGAVSWGATGLPTGLTISSGGLISGSPSANGTFVVVVTATDSCSPTPQPVQRTFNLQINTAALAITTPTLPNGLAQQNYSATISGSGGVQPYTWTVSAGSLPTGLILNSSTGAVTGTPTTAQSVTFTIQLADNAAHTVPATYTVTISAASAAHNEYCSPSNTWIGPTTDGLAHMPARCYFTAMSGTPSPGTVRGPVSTLSAFNAAYAAASCGDVIQIAAGSSFTGPVTLTGKGCDDQHYITIESTGVSNLAFPPEGTTLTPCTSGVASLPNRLPYPCPNPQVLTARFVATSNNSALVLNGADHIRLLGIEPTRVSTPGASITSLVDMTATGAVQTNHIILDRTWDHGITADGSFPQTRALDTSTTRAVYLAQSNYVAVIDSYISDIYDNGGGTIGGTAYGSSNGNTDAQCIAGGFGGIANSGWGVYKFVNDHCEASGEGLLFGGGGGPALTPVGCTIMVNCNLDTPTDIEVRLVHFFKPLSWNGNTTTVNTVGWPVVKNGFEMKTGARGFFEGNVIENCWYSAQGCSSFNVAPINQQSGGSTPVPTCPTCVVQDFIYRYNYSYNTAYGIAVYSFTPTTCSTCQSQGMNRVNIHDNVIGDNMNMGNLTGLNSGDAIEILADNDPSGRGLNKTQNLTISHNTFVKDIRGMILFGGPTDNTRMVNLVMQNNLWSYGNFGFVSVGNSGGCDTVSGGSFFNALNNCVTGFTVDHNGEFNVVGTLGRNWPSNGSGLGNWFFTSPTTTGSYLNSAGATVSGALGFTNYGTGNSNFNPSVFALTSGSPLHNAGSDGKDIGADISTLQNKIAGVRK